MQIRWLIITADLILPSKGIPHFLHALAANDTNRGT